MLPNGVNLHISLTKDYMLVIFRFQFREQFSLFGQNGMLPLTGEKDLHNLFISYPVMTRKFEVNFNALFNEIM